MQCSTMFQTLIESYGYLYTLFFIQVYSHDTGRVKIKLAETARPKTPIVVTRSLPNDNDNKFVNEVNK